ncbi:hypothetical protein BRETT_001083 [Brettanomyces bruxellensis]|uniref:ER membrane protein complex subunit 3 n=1 Tax=Dekkera bruxellensis TaxID=5007 RepID=A0A871RFV5_DEKBR|nr:uncharacterized protein BRETT_001083 [Brettanomyces bruxellensis]QOU21361.1 hypothetical protein BRETT_001083 [Brettanomyces bruxellensis]
MVSNIPELLLDPYIKLWVLLPISVVMVLVGVLRTYISMTLDPSPKIEDHKLLREQQHIRRLANYCNNDSVFRNKMEYDAKVRYFVDEYSGTKYLRKLPPKDPNEQPNPLTDSSSNDFMMQSVKSSLANWVPQSIILWWVNFFFKGYVIMRLPFAVTSNFKPMLQTSIDTTDLDASYVSSIIYSLIFNDASMVNKLMTQQQQQPIQPQLAGAGPSAQQLFQNRIESLKIARFNSCLDRTEQRLLHYYESK